MRTNPNETGRIAIVAALVAAVVALAPAGIAHGQQKQARVWGVVTDENSAPVPDVSVTAEVPETGAVVARTMTDAEGKYSLVLNDATVKYLYRVTKDGYVPLAEQLEVSVKGNAEYNMVLPSLESVHGGVQADGSYAMHPDAVEPFNRGGQAARSGDLAAAAAAFEEVLAIDGKVVPALTALSAIYVEQKKFGEAATLAGRVLEIEPANPKGVVLRYFASKGNGASIGELKPMLVELEKVEPKKAAFEYAQIGVSHFNDGDTAGAQAAFTHALELDPELASAHYQLGLSLVASEPGKAKEHFERVLELAPDSEDAKQATEMLSYLQ